MEGANNTPPFLYTNKIYKWLETALDYGITEYEFWNMTIGELTRLIESKNRMETRRIKQIANFDYTLADLIGRSIARIYSKTANYPNISEVYPALFDSEEVKQAKEKQKADMFAKQLKQFAANHNNRIKEVAKVNE